MQWGDLAGLPLHPLKEKKMKVSDTVQKEIFKLLSKLYRKAENDFDKTLIDLIAYFVKKGMK